MTRLAAILLAVALSAAPAAAQRMSYGKAPRPPEAGPKKPDGVEFDQKIGGQVPLDLTFYDHFGKEVSLRDCVGKKPTILVLAYYRCPRLCNLVLTGLIDGLREAHQKDANFTAGGPFNVVTVSIDPKEDPNTLGRPRRQQAMREYDGRSEHQPGWWFLSSSHGQGTDVADADEKVHKLAEAVGFRYALHQKGRDYQYRTGEGWFGKDGEKLGGLARDYDYQHASGVVVLTPDGKVSQYLLGINYPPDELRSAVRGASAGKLGTLFELSESLPLCFAYDEVSGHYRPTMLLLAVLYAPAMLAVAWFAFRTYRRGRREKPLNPGDVPAVAVPGERGA